jgi:hypothetical protein
MYKEQKNEKENIIERNTVLNNNKAISKKGETEQ